VLVRSVGGQSLEAVHIAERDDVSGDLADASEDEPWWRLLGSSLAHSQSAPDGCSVRLQFVIADARPRTLRLSVAPAAVRGLIESGE